jgi:hypothetical protein
MGRQLKGVLFLEKPDTPALSMSHGVPVPSYGIGFSQVEATLEVGGEMNVQAERWKKYVVHI